MKSDFSLKPQQSS